MPYTGKKIEMESSGGGGKGPGKYRFAVTRFESRTSKKGNAWWSYDLKLYAPGDKEGFEVNYQAFFESMQDSMDAFLTVIGCTEAGIPFLRDDKDVEGKHGVVLMQHVEELDKDDDAKIWNRLKPLRWGAWYHDDERSASEVNNGKDAESIMKNMDKCENIEGLWGKDKARYEASMQSGGIPSTPAQEPAGNEDLPF